MSLLRRDVPQPPPDPATRLAALTARHDEALTVLAEALRHHAKNRQLADVLLDVRNALNPPRQGDTHR